MRIRRVIMCLTMALFMVCTLAGCANNMPAEVSARGADKISIVTTIFPVYDWVENLLGDNPAGAEVTMLLDNGVDLHSYQPTAQDMIKISECDMFVYVGGEYLYCTLRDAVLEN